MAEEAVFPPPQMSNILTFLCPELIVEIFGYLKIRDLSRVARVCKQFKELAYSKRFWQCEEFYSGREQCPGEDLVQSLVQKGIQRLHVVPNEEDMKLQNFQQLLPELVYFNLDLHNLSCNALGRVLEVTRHVDFSSLRHLCLNFRCYEDDDDEKLEDFLEQFPNVDNLTWSMKRYWGHGPTIGTVKSRINKELKVVLEKYNKLQKLEVSFPMSWIPFPDVQYHHCYTLEHLTMKDFEISGSTLVAIGQCFPNLRSLVFLFCYYTHAEDIVQDCRKLLGHLQELDFNQCENIFDEHIEDLEDWAMAQHIVLEFTPCIEVVEEYDNFDIPHLMFD